MQDVKEFEQTYKTFMDSFKRISSATTSREVDELEIKCVRTLQLMEAQIGYVGRGLYDETIRRRRDISSGIANAPVEKAEPVKKAKKSRKK